MTIDIFLCCFPFVHFLHRAFHAIVVSHSGVVRHRGFDVAALPQ
jgi:hypothetical protein